jgi:natural resistance-associated macrophage protein 2
MAITFAVIFFKSGPDYGQLFFGMFVPTVPEGTLDAAIGVVGCIIMPHNVYLYSALVLSRKINNKDPRAIYEATYYNRIESAISLIISFFINTFVIGTIANYSLTPGSS